MKMTDVVVLCICSLSLGIAAALLMVQILGSSYFVFTGDTSVRIEDPWEACPDLDRAFILGAYKDDGTILLSQYVKKSFNDEPRVYSAIPRSLQGSVGYVAVATFCEDRYKPLPPEMELFK